MLAMFFYHTVVVHAVAVVVVVIAVFVADLATVSAAGDCDSPDLAHELFVLLLLL